MSKVTQYVFKLPLKPATGGRKWRYAAVGPDGDLWVFTHEPIPGRRVDHWVLEDHGQAMYVSGGWEQTTQPVKRLNWWQSLWQRPQQFHDADRYRFARDSLFDTQIWNVWSAYRFAKRYDSTPELYDECIDLAMAECLRLGLWK